MKSIKIFFSAIVLLAVIPEAQAQDFTVYTMPYLQQRSALNPSFIPNHKLHIGLPVISSVGLSIGNTGFKYEDLVKKRADDSLYIDLSGFLNTLNDNNYLGASFQTDIFSFGIKVAESNYISFNITEKASFQVRYPKDFFELAINGNTPSIGEELNFNFGINVLHYREYALGFSREIGDKLVVGAKLKYLYGMENISTEHSDIKLTTDPNNLYDLTASTNILIQTSGIDSTDSDNYLFGLKNTGFGADLGIQYNFNEKLNLSASVINIGQIKWRQNVKNFESANPGDEFTFSGFNLNDYLSGGDSVYSEILDSMINTFEIDSNYNEYSTGVGTEYHISLSYVLPAKQTIGGHAYWRIFDKKFIPGISVYYTKEIGKWFTVAVNYSPYSRSWTNLGLGLRLNGGPVQYYIASDNILSVMFPTKAKYVNFRMGLNLTFGNKSKKIKIDEASE